jgi:hypothetical protein
MGKSKKVLLQNTDRKNKSLQQGQETGHRNIFNRMEDVIYICMLGCRDNYSLKNFEELIKNLKFINEEIPQIYFDTFIEYQKFVDNHDPNNHIYRPQTLIPEILEEMFQFNLKNKI